MTLLGTGLLSMAGVNECHLSVRGRPVGAGHRTREVGRHSRHKAICSLAKEEQRERGNGWQSIRQSVGSIAPCHVLSNISPERLDLPSHELIISFYGCAPQSGERQFPSRQPPTIKSLAIFFT